MKIIAGNQYRIQITRLFEYLDEWDNSCFIPVLPGDAVHVSAIISTSESLKGTFESVLCEIQDERLGVVASALVGASHLKEL